MEGIKLELKLGELKRENLRKSLEQAKAQASSILLFTLQWKELENHFDLLQQNIAKRVEVVELLEKSRDHLQRSIDEKSRELVFKEMDIDLKENMIKEYDEALELKAKELECLQSSIKECSNRLDIKQNELVRSHAMIENHSKQLYEEEKALDSFKSLIQDCTEAIEAKEKKHDELDKSVKYYAAKIKSKVKKLGLIEEKIVIRSSELHSRDIEFDLLQTSVRRSEKQLESTKEELDSVKAKVRGYSEDLELKMQEFNAIQMCIEECSQELHLKEKQLSSVQISVQGCSQQLKVDEEKLISIKNSILECSNELESKKQHLEAVQKYPKQLSDVLESKEKQLDLVEKTCSEGLKEDDAKEKHLVSLKGSVESLEKLETGERQFEAHVKEFELREKQFVSVQNAVEEQSKELDLKEKQLTNSQVPSDNPSSSLSQVHGTTNTVTVKPVAPNQIMTEQQEHFMFSNANETSFTDIGVVDAMDGRSLQGIQNEHLDDPHLNENEVLAALRMSPDPARFVLDLMLGTSSQYLKGGTGTEESVLKIYVFMLEQLLQVSPLVQPNVKADALKLAIEWKTKMKLSAENSTEIMSFLQFVAAFGLVSSFNKYEIFKLLETAFQHQQAPKLCRILGFASMMIPDIVRSLIKRKQYIEAVRFVCAFDSKDKCPPEMLLNQCWEDINRVARDSCMMGKNSPETLEKVTDEQIAALKLIIECIEDYKLESSLPVEAIEKCIAELEKQKMNRNHPSPVTPGTQLLGLSNKRARTDGPAI